MHPYLASLLPILTVALRSRVGSGALASAMTPMAASLYAFEGIAPAVPSAGVPSAEVPEVAASAVRTIDEVVEDESPPLCESKTIGRSMGDGLQLPSIVHRRTRDSRSMHSQEDDSADDEDYFEAEKEPRRNFTRQHCGKGKGGCCYRCYVLVFFSFVVFASFLKLMVISPLPPENWHWQSERFPTLENQQQLWVQVPAAHQAIRSTSLTFPRRGAAATTVRSSRGNLPGADYTYTCSRGLSPT